MSGISGPAILVARREIVSRLQQRGFRIGLAILIVLIGIVAVAPKFFGHGGSTSYDIGVVGAHTDSVSAALRRVAADEHVTVHLHTGSAGEAPAMVRKGTWDAAIVDDTRVLAKSADSGAATLAQAAHRSRATYARLEASGLTAQQVSHAFAAAPLALTATGSSHSAERQVIATITVVFLFAQLIMFCTWVAMGVVEEKASRVVELLLSAVRPLQLLGGKLLGIGALAVGQVVLIAVTALVVSTVVGSLSIPGAAYTTVAVSFGWFLLGLAFFAALSAALASLVSRQEEVSAVLSPVTALLMVSYLGSFAVAAAPDATAARVFSIIPPISCIAMPARIARGGVPAVDIIAAVALMAGLTVVVLVLAARVYRAAILHTGSRLTLRSVWRAEPVAEVA